MEYHILNCGAGVQSTTVALLVEDGEIVLPTETGKFDYAIFADTGDEPEEVYRHLEWLRKTVSYPVELVAKDGPGLGDMLIAQDGKRHASIPAFTDSGLIRRQCTKEFKVEPIELFIKREILGLKPRQRVKDKIVQYFCFSTDEPDRAARTKARFQTLYWGNVEFPLFNEDIWMSRLDCTNYLEQRVPHTVPRSACVFCPFKSNAEWLRLKRDDPKGWERAVEIDDALRNGKSNASQGMRQDMFLHRDRLPLAKADLGQDQGTLFDMDCEGGCGL